MKKIYRSVLSLLLAAALLCTWLPAGVGAHEAEMLDYSQADEIFDGLYRRIQSHKTPMDDARRAEAVEAYLENAEGVKPGTVRRMGNALTWETDDGVACHFSPRLYKLMTEDATAAAEPSDSRKTMELTPPAAKSTTASGRDVYLFAPYYGLDNDFEGEDGSYDEWGGILAHFTDGDYYLYEREAATIDAIADALENSAMVIIDSHGNTDTGDIYGTSSYICLQSGRGITAADYSYDPAAGVSHAYYAGTSVNGAMSYYEVDGTAIANHMERNASNNLLWNATCFGMTTDGICGPLLRRGVGVVYGYSCEVSFGGDQCWMEVFMDEMTNGKTVRDAAASMKRECGAWDYSRQICEANGWTSYWINHTAADAVANGEAFPVFVSARDSYPANPNAVQNVYSDWQLPRMELTLELRLPDGVKSPNIEGYVFYEGRLPTPAGRPRNQEHDYSFVGWSFVDFAPSQTLPGSLYSPGQEFSFGYYDDSDPLSFGDNSAVLFGVYSYRDGNRLLYTTQVPDGPYDPYDPSAMFHDMPYGTWYYDSVRFAVAEELVTGYTDGTFRPENTLRRSEAVAILYRAAGSPPVEPEAIFEDVAVTDWHAAAVTWAVRNNIVKGVSETRFAPDQLVTRGQMAVFLYRFAGAANESTGAIAAFPDAASVPDWAAKEMAWAVETGLINGSRINGQDYLQPMSTATRAQYVTILMRYMTA
ncbi:MAG: S-layer homology domain-containing protein [Ruminococcaceae bacterium]|nr:S-layer homology domain-containing protein [Oscillospiraceae bacterium]